MSELLPNSQLLEEIPPAVWQALNHRAMGENWGKAAELAGIHVRTLKKYSGVTPIWLRPETISSF